ncbi:MAG: hypothetical protein AB7G93_13365 [Bdellovibrionales bacterium]
MKQSLILSLTFFISGVTGCSSFPKSTREMEKRANYGVTGAVLPQVERPNRKKQRVEEIFMGGRLLSTGDWFVGGRLMLVVNEPDWIFDDPKLGQTIKH